MTEPNDAGSLRPGLATLDMADAINAARQLLGLSEIAVPSAWKCRSSSMLRWSAAIPLFLRRWWCPYARCLALSRVNSLAELSEHASALDRLRRKQGRDLCCEAADPRRHGGRARLRSVRLSRGPAHALLPWPLWRVASVLVVPRRGRGELLIVTPLHLVELATERDQARVLDSERVAYRPERLKRDRKQSRRA